MASNHGIARIDAFLAKEKSGKRSSPAGMYWDTFYKDITKGFDKNNRPSLPLILASSIASESEKHQRLREQLLWAEKNGILDEALGLLDKIPREEWNQF